MNRFGQYLACYLSLVLGIGVFGAGCIPDRLSWSPDGRYLAFVGPDDKALWIWDTRTGEAERLTGMGRDYKAEILFCRYLPSGNEILFGAGSMEKAALLRLDPRRPNVTHSIADDVSPYYGLSKDGEYIYYFQKGKDNKSNALIEHDLRHDVKKEILNVNSDVGPMVAPNATRSRILLGGGGLFLLDRDKNTSRVLYLEEKTEVWWPAWVNNSQILFAIHQESNQEPLGMLVSYSLDHGTSRVLCENIYGYLPFSLSPDGKSVALTVPTSPKGKTGQVAIVDVATGEKKVLTDEAFISPERPDVLVVRGAGFAVFSPDGQQIAYLTPPDLDNDAAVVRILNLQTGKRITVWRNDEERLFSIAESLTDSGNIPQALSAYRDLLARFPQARLAEEACYRMMRIYLESPLTDLDRAFEMLKKIKENHALVEQVAPLFWRGQDRLATDPPEDWIQTYGTDASQKEFGFNSDLTRDLRGLWVRWGKERLYVRIDYGSNRDLTGLTFQDTLLLFDYDSPGNGLRQISPTTEWDRGAEREVLVRHWFEASEKSQYDMGIRDGRGEIVCRFVGSGFAEADNPAFELVHILQEDSSSVVYSISRRVLDLKDGQKVNMQVCTFKGGIESYKKLERPRVETTDGRTVCDVADSFGPENTEERIEADLRTNTDPRAPAIIKGCAATFEMK
jgi:Tol biopolymer transport system component